jgi:hypothetical protein
MMKQSCLSNELTHSGIGFHTIVVGLLISARFIGIGTTSMMKADIVVGIIYSAPISIALTVQT